MTIKEKVNKIIEKYYDDDEGCYVSTIYDDPEKYEGEHNLDEEIIDCFNKNNIRYVRGSESGYDTQFFLAFAFIDEKGELGMVTVYTE